MDFLEVSLGVSTCQTSDGQCMIALVRLKNMEISVVLPANYSNSESEFHTHTHTLYIYISYVCVILHCCMSDSIRLYHDFQPKPKFHLLPGKA